MNENQVEQQEPLPWTSLVPSSWFKRIEDSSIWVTAYRVFKVSKDDLASGPKIVDLYQVRAIILYGTLKYLDTRHANIEALSANQWHIDASAIQEREAPEDVYLLLLMPFTVDGNQIDESHVRQEMKTTVGLFAAFNGRNMVYEHLFDNIFSLADGKVSSFSPVFANPLSFAAPDVTIARIDTITKADRAITTLQETEKNRVRLSLRWFTSALYHGGIDAYLEYWIALETLSMPNTTNIRPLIEDLASAYSLSYQVARERFSIGRLYGFRGQIVHHGIIVPIHAQLLSYLEALYADVLFVHLELQSAGRAASVLKSPGFRLDEYLP